MRYFLPMITESPAEKRILKTVQLEADLVVVGGGFAGSCCAITAARQGLRVILVQDRPVLGGNASSEVRLWLLGATVHMGANNRWAREGGVTNEIMMENLWRNPEGNPLIFDTVLLEKVTEEKNITLLLNTSCFEVQKSGPDTISAVRAYCSQNETLYHASAPLFCDASGDGVVGFLSGAAFRMGAESKDEFGELFAPTGEFGHLLGHSIYFYSKDVGRPVKFVAPSFALTDVEGKIPRYRSFNSKDHGCKLWWLEWGGRLDTIHETETIKWELWKVVYGVWNYIKNSGNFPEAENLTLEWVGHIPGKRESRRFEGDYILKQQDVIERREHADAVAFGGWSIDLHPAEGVFAEIAGSHHLHSKGVYQIPYRCYYSRNIDNLFLSGRIISSTHVAFGTTRVMATCSVGAQAVAHAAALCIEHGEKPRDILKPKRMRVLHQRLGRDGHFLPAVSQPDPLDLARGAKVSASSACVLGELPAGGPARALTKRIAQMIPLQPGKAPEITLWADVENPVTLEVELRGTSTPWHYTPDVALDRVSVHVPAGKNVPVKLPFSASVARAGYGFIIVPEAASVSIHTSEQRVTGLLRLDYRGEERGENVGGNRYDVFCPERRPGGHNLAMKIEPAIPAYQPGNLLNGWQRPTSETNAWVAAVDDANPEITLTWAQPVTLSAIDLHLDGDFDHAMETVLWGHPERAVPFCVKSYEVLDDQGRVVAEATENHHSLASHRLAEAITTKSLTVRVRETWGAPAAIFEVRCYA